MKNFYAERMKEVPDSLITLATVLAQKYGAINLASGYPDLPTPLDLKERAGDYISRDYNQYTMNQGLKSLRETLAYKLMGFNNISADPESEITITCGAAEALFLASLAIINQGDEVIVFEPAFESYVPNILMAGGIPRIIKLSPPHWDFDGDLLAATFNNRTRAIIINTPHNPTGKVFTGDELEFIATLCRKWGAIAVTDEIYEHITFDGAPHISMASLPGMASQTITVGGFSKTFSCTGWRIGYFVAPEEISNIMRKIHTYITVCAPAPLQEAMTHIPALGNDFFHNLQILYQAARDFLHTELERAGFRPFRSRGSFFMMADFTALGYHDDREFAFYLARDVGVAVVPESAFCRPSEDIHTTVRFCFARKRETLEKVRLHFEKIKTGSPE
jgi:aspartate/methionine/tyrosine aminotransferase